MGARTVRKQIEHDPARASEPLDTVLTLTETAQAEMCALIFALRPESLQTEGLVAALQKQAAYVTARHGIQVQTLLGEEPTVSLDVKEALY